MIVDRNGEGALHYAPETGLGVDKTIVDVGVARSAGSVTLCKKSATDHVILQRVDAVSVKGQVRLDGIGVRTTHYAEPGHSNPNTHLVGTMRGVPDGLQSPDGFRVVTTWPDSRAPIGEIVVTMTKTGAEGGEPRRSSAPLQRERSGTPADTSFPFRSLWDGAVRRSVWKLTGRVRLAASFKTGGWA